MYSITMYMLLQEAERAFANRTAGVGYVALHPSKGLFLGVDKDKKAVFCPVKDVVPAQPVPAFLNPGSVPEQACSDTAILECALYRVRLSDAQRLTANAGAFIEGGEIKTASEGVGDPVYRPPSGHASLFNKCAMKLSRLCSFSCVAGSRPYRAPAP